MKIIDLEKGIIEGIVNAFDVLYQHKLSKEEVHLQPTKKDFDGEFTFVTFPYSRISKSNPEETAKSIGSYLLEHVPAIHDFNVVKGFLNLSIEDKVWIDALQKIAGHHDFGIFPDKKETVLVEYSSPNTNKPLHLGHLRNILLGFSLSKILAANGYNVTRVQIINDRGIHICKSMLAYKKFGQGETPESSGIKGDHLIGKYYVRFDQEFKKEIAELIQRGVDKKEAEKTAPIILEAQEILKNWEAGDPETVELWKRMNSWVYDGFDATYDQMGVAFDKIYYESETYLLGKRLVEQGLKEGMFFQKEDGSAWVDLTDHGLDEKLLLRGDGTSVYITQDMGTADIRFDDFKFEKSIYVVGNEQDYHFDVLFKILKKLGRTYTEGLYHLSYGMVDLPEGKMKSREGTVVDADDLMREMIETAREHTEELGKIEGFSKEEAKVLYEIIGLGALKYFILKVDPRKRMLFNPKESVDFQGNTGPFIQYTHARISAILRRADELGLSRDGVPDVLHPTEVSLIKLLYDYPSKVALAGEEYSPSVIGQYVYDLAKEYNRFYAEVSIFNAENDEIKAFRVLLSSQVARLIKKGMELLGILVPERM